jgi:hypothetical protein
VAVDPQLQQAEIGLHLLGLPRLQQAGQPAR